MEIWGEEKIRFFCVHALSAHRFGAEGKAMDGKGE